MFRILAKILYMLTNQHKRESADYFWKIYEKAKNASNKNAKNLYGCILHNLFLQYGSNIPLETEFGGFPILPHGINGIFISRGAKIGEGCTIFHQVTIGSNMLKDSKGYGAPTIGKNVYIGAGAKIIGNIHIGNNCRIGANCVVTQDIPDNATVVLSEPRVIIYHKKRNNEFQEFV